MSCLDRPLLGGCKFREDDLVVLPSQVVYFMPASKTLYDYRGGHADRKGIDRREFTSYVKKVKVIWIGNTEKEQKIRVTNETEKNISPNCRFRRQVRH